MNSSGQQHSSRIVSTVLTNPVSQETCDAAAKKPVGIVALLLLPLLAVVVCAVAYVLLRRNGILVDLPDELGGIVFYLLWGAGALWYASRAHIAPGRMFALPQRRTDWSLVALVVPLLFFSLACLYLEIVALSFLIPEVAEWFLEPEPEVLTSPISAILLVLSTTIVGPIIEEVVFRGVLFPLWVNRWGFRAGVVGTSLLFGMLHPVEMVGAVAFGLVAAVVYFRTGSLLVPIIIHMIFNTVAFFAGIGSPDDTVISLTDFRSDWMEAAASFAIPLVILIAFLRWGATREHARMPRFTQEQPLTEVT